MTPKKKAFELVNSMRDIPDGGFGSVGLYEGKQCALVAVNEILNEIPDGYMGNYDEERKQFWKDVKIEIENL